MQAFLFLLAAISAIASCVASWRAMFGPAEERMTHVSGALAAAAAFVVLFFVASLMSW